MCTLVSRNFSQPQQISSKRYEIIISAFSQTHIQKHLISRILFSIRENFSFFHSHICFIITDRHITNFGCLLVCQEEALTEKCSVGTQVNEEDLEPRTSEEEGRSIVST